MKQSSLFLIVATTLLFACDHGNRPASTNGIAGTLKLNDTGVTVYLDDVNASTRLVSNTTVPAPQTTTTPPSTLPGQDADHGLDVAKGVADIDGKKGFNFTKLDANGVALTDQTVAFTVQEWPCVLDNNTGLIWESKKASGLQFYGYYYTWYDPNYTTNGGHPGSVGDATTCSDLTLCNTDEYIKAINALKLCGYSDWRLPTREELRSLIDYSVTGTGATIDTNYFPYTANTDTWTSQTASYADTSNSYAWEVHFDSKFITEGHPKSSTGVVVRLVRGTPNL